MQVEAAGTKHRMKLRRTRHFEGETAKRKKDKFSVGMSEDLEVACLKHFIQGLDRTIPYSTDS